MRGLIDLLTSLETVVSDEKFDLNNEKYHKGKTQNKRQITKQDYTKQLDDILETIESCSGVFEIPYWIKELNLPKLPQDFTFKNFDLQIRTLNCLARIGALKKPQNLANMTFGELLSTKNFGFKSLLDLLFELKLYFSKITKTTSLTINANQSSTSNYYNSKKIENEDIAYYEKFVESLLIIRDDLKDGKRYVPNWIRNFNLPKLAPDFSFLELDLKNRTKNTLVKMEIWEEPQKLSNKNVSELLESNVFGIVSLIDLMTKLEPYVYKMASGGIDEEIIITQKPLFESISYQPPLTQNNKITNSEELKKEATNLLELVYFTKIKSKDFRFGHIIQQVDKKANDVLGLATRIIIGENIPRDETKTLLLLKELKEKISSIQEMKLEDELKSYLQPIVIERDREIVTGRFGLNGKGLSTLQAIGDEFQVTRERIRQICKKWTNKLQESSVFAPKIENTIQFIAENAPNSCDVMMEKLVVNGFTRNLFQLENIKEITNLFKIDCPFILKEVDGKMYILSNENEITVNLIHKKSRRAIEHWGASTIEEITFQLNEEKQNVSNEFVEQVLTSREDFSWLDKEGGWFWLTSVPRNRLLNQMRKVLSVAEKIDVSELRSGISRHHRTKSLSPPKRVLLEFCKQTNLGRIEDSLIIPNGNLNWEEELSEMEQFLVLILKENSNVMRRVEFEKVCMELGMSNPAFQVYLSYSPVIVKFGIGVYGLRGINIPIGLIESMTASRKRGRVLKDWGWKNNNIWIAYQLSESAIKSGVIGVPASVKDYIEGEFRLKTEENQTVGRVVIRGTSAWGFSPFFSRRGGEIGDYMLLLFDTKNMEIKIRIGDKDLIEEFQEADS